MKRFLILICAFVFTTNIYSQEDFEGSVTRLKQSDRVVFDFIYDLWQNVPDNIELSIFQRGFGYSSYKDFPLGSSNFSVAIGFGISAHNMYSNGILTQDTAMLSEFIPLPTTYTTSTETKKIGYKINKLSLTYLETPVEFRFRTKGSNPFKVYAGFRFGVLLNEYTKYVGDDFISGTDNDIKFKEYKHLNIEKFRWGPTFRVGYKWANLFAAYSMNSVFAKDKGPQIFPITVGFSVSPY